MQPSKLCVIVSLVNSYVYIYKLILEVIFLMSKKKINTFIGSIGAFIGVLVFLSYIPQIIANIGGEKSQPLQPLVAAISCLLWVIYGLTNEHKIDYILIIPNAAGVVFGFLTFITAL